MVNCGPWCHQCARCFSKDLRRFRATTRLFKKRRAVRRLAFGFSGPPCLSHTESYLTSKPFERWLQQLLAWTALPKAPMAPTVAPVWILRKHLNCIDGCARGLTDAGQSCYGHEVQISKFVPEDKYRTRRARLAELGICVPNLHGWFSSSFLKFAVSFRGERVPGSVPWGSEPCAFAADAKGRDLRHRCQKFQQINLLDFVG